MTKFSRLFRFTLLLIAVIWFLVHRSVSKRQSERIFALKEQLRSEEYEMKLTEGDAKGIKTVYEPISDDIPKENAVLFTLAREKDFAALARTVRSYEDRFNGKFHYDWIFANQEHFSDDFKRQISTLVSGETFFELIPEEYWSYPSWIDQRKAQQVRAKSRYDIMYGGSGNYRFMCRFFSGFFYKLDRLKQYDYVWRVEPETELLCDVNYDPFGFMKNNNIHYGFALSIIEFPETVPTLWDTVSSFVEEHPRFINKDNLLDFISDDDGHSYNMCHFWTNFEIVDLSLFRSEAYETFFRSLDVANGFFYERWGDAPVHSIAASLFLAKNQIHHFADIGYYHKPNHNCPIDDNVWVKNRCLCDQNHDVTFRDYSCASRFYELTGREKPQGWQRHTGKGDYFT